MLRELIGAGTLIVLAWIFFGGDDETPAPPKDTASADQPTG